MLRKKVAPELALAIIISGSITVIISLVNIILCAVAIIFRFTCSSGDINSISGSKFFIVTLYRVYIQDDSCANSLIADELTRSQTVFILTCITLAFAVVSFILASSLIAAMVNAESSTYFKVTAYLYVGVSLSILIIDLTFAIHFGLDVTTLANKLNVADAVDGQRYMLDLLRLGALLLMSITLKGYIYHIVNTMLLVYIIIFTVHQQSNNKYEHNIHKLGVLNAYENPRPHNETWPTQSDNNADVPRGNPQWNREFNDDEPRRDRENPIADNMTNRQFERSESWLRSQPTPSNVGNRPFSYLDDPKRGPAVPADTNWHRDWPPQPHVPAPDYSPPARRLKSALKQGFP